MKKAYFALFASTLFCIFLFLIRMQYSGNIKYLFLNWNLFLAWIPLFAGFLIRKYYTPKSNKIFIFGLIFIWLIFFPNAPYVITDFIHLWKKDTTPIWFDLMLIASYAITSLQFAFLSLYLVHKSVEKNKGRVIGWLLAIIVLALSGFGVYLGRFPQFNSWNIFTAPFDLTKHLIGYIINPLSNMQALAFSAVFSSFLLINYIVVYSFTSFENENNRN